MKFTWIGCNHKGFLFPIDETLLFIAQMYIQKLCFYLSWFLFRYFVWHIAFWRNAGQSSLPGRACRRVVLDGGAQGHRSLGRSVSAADDVGLHERR